MIRILFTLFLICLAPFAQARCLEKPDISPQTLTQLRAKAAQAPFHRGNLWQVQKDGVTSYVFGTMHLYDPRHETLLERLKPLIASTEQTLVEITNESQAEMKTLFGQNPALYSITEGPSLMDRLGPEAWAKLVEKLQGRGMPPFMAAKFKPWFLGFSMMLPKCALEDLKAKRFGIDKGIEATAKSLGKPMQSLDDVGTLLALFSKDPLPKQVEDMRWSLMLDLPEDPTTSGIIAFYFQEEAQVAWVYTLHYFETLGQTLLPEDADKLKAITTQLMDELLIGRNQQWMETLVPELSRTPSFVAVGALHLPGEYGVLRLLETQGFEVQPLAMKLP
ncbi:TraB/GumN family protein [Thalassobius sp. S69A]|uniref:TraB/GumN family protein n=1 Tax=unclassified Thalassovita TaxID=2619711 RepID=UPI003C7D5A92